MGASFTLIGMSARSAASADGPPGCRGFCASAVHSVATGSQLAEQARSEGPERIVQQAQMTGGMGSRPMDGGTGKGRPGHRSRHPRARRSAQATEGNQVPQPLVSSAQGPAATMAMRSPRSLRAWAIGFRPWRGTPARRRRTPAVPRPRGGGCCSRTHATCCGGSGSRTQRRSRATSARPAVPRRPSWVS